MKTLFEFLNKNKVISGYPLYKRTITQKTAWGTRRYYNVFLDLGNNIDILKKIKYLQYHINNGKKIIDNFERKLKQHPDWHIIISPDNTSEYNFFRDVVDIDNGIKTNDTKQTFEYIGELKDLNDFNYEYWEKHDYIDNTVYDVD